MFIRKTIENGVYSPYREIERLIKENDVKDKKISELLTELNTAKSQGDELKEADLITRIVEHSVKLGVEVAKNVELVLGRIYRGTTKFAEHFKWLEDYIANTSSAGDILKAIAELNETLKRGVKDGVTIVNATNFKPQITTQNLDVPMPSLGQQETKQIEE